MIYRNMGYCVGVSPRCIVLTPEANVRDYHAFDEHRDRLFFGKELFVMSYPDGCR